MGYTSVRDTSHLSTVLPEDKASLALLRSLLCPSEEVEVVDMLPCVGDVLFRDGITSVLEHTLDCQ